MQNKRFIITPTIIIVAVVAFFIGMNYGKNKSVQIPQTATTTVSVVDKTATDNDGMEDEHAFLQADYNFDGKPDRLKMLDCGATGNCSYEVDLYDAKTKDYLPTMDVTDANDEVNFGVTNPVVNKIEKLVCSYANVGAGSYHIGVYKYSTKDNTFSQVKEFSGSTDKVHACSLK